jgi:hypothetical protein
MVDVLTPADDEARWLAERRMFPKVGHTLGLVDLPSNSRPDLAVAIQLLPLFDLRKVGRVSHDDWMRGVKALGVDGLSDPGLWSELISYFDSGGTREVHLSQIEWVLPVDPMVGLLLGSLVRAVVHVAEDTWSLKRKSSSQAFAARSRAVLNMRRRILEPAMRGWREVISMDRRLANFSRRLLRHSEWRALRAWCALTDERRALARLFKRAMNRELTGAFDAWASSSEEVAATACLLTACLLTACLLTACRSRRPEPGCKPP